MSKFRMGSIKNVEEKNIKSDEQKQMVGAGLLSDVSKAEIKLKIVNIPRDKIRKNPKNKYSISDIKSLAQSVRDYGLLQAIHVGQPKDGIYYILGGERRITAIDMLIEDPNVTDWNEDTLIPCVIKGFEEVNLPLSDENKERYAIITTNKESRNYTDADNLMELREWKLIISELREKQVETINGYDDNGEEKKIQIKGEKTRDILAEVTGISRGRVNQFEAVENKGTDAIKEALLGNSLSVNVASKAVKELDAEEQDRLAEDSKTKEITVKDLINYKTVRKADKKYISKKEFNKDIKDITNILKNDEIELDEKDFEQYHFYIKQLKKLLVKGE